MFDEPATGKYAAPPVFENGSAGLMSTTDDFNAFAQMMLNGGRLGTEYILSRPSVELMTSDQLAPGDKQGSEFVLGVGRSWGFGHIGGHRAVILRCATAAATGTAVMRHLVVFRPRARQ